MRVLVASFNAGQSGGVKPDDFTPLLAPSLKTAPDLLVVGLQETSPLALGMLGITGMATLNFQEAIQKALEVYTTPSSPDAEVSEGYIEVASSSHGNLQMFIYAKASRASSIRVEWSSANCGVGWLLSNKGALSARLTVKPSESSTSEKEETYTFCCAHLSPHSHNLERRNADFEALVRRTSFGSRGLYDTNHLVVFGDLNYRLDKEAEQWRTSSETFWPVDSEQRRAIFMAHDQLSVEMQNGRTLQGLAEAPVKFKPTYKYLKKHLSQYDPKRVPAWCDRIAYASAGSVTSEGYANVMSFVTSDHKPIWASLDFSPPNDSAAVLSSPFGLDPLAYYKLVAGNGLSMIVGFLWGLLQMIGAGSEAAGLFVILCGLLATIIATFWLA